MHVDWYGLTWCIFLGLYQLQIGGTYAKPVIMPPEVAIGAIGRLQVSTHYKVALIKTFVFMRQCFQCLFQLHLAVFIIYKLARQDAVHVFSL